MHCIVTELPDGSYLVSCGTITPTHGFSIDSEFTIASSQFPAWVSEHELHNSPRWVWADTATIYAALLRNNVRVEKAHDLRLARAILRNNLWVNRTAFMPLDPTTRREADSWNAPAAAPSNALFDPNPSVSGDPLAEYQRQLEVLATGQPAHRGRLAYLLAAESAGALIAVEMTYAGLPWDAAIHDALLAEALGPRPAHGMRPAKLEALAVQIRGLLDAEHLNPDSPKELLKALQSAGLDVKSTSKWEIKEQKHPVVPVLLEYKKLSRLLSANGWGWMDQWISNGRFRPSFVPGGVVTGRWGADGGGALQLPHSIRPAAVADPGWTFVIADAAQLEPRILAAMSGDRAMAMAGAGHDMYQGIADAGVVESRDHAKFGMLGAMYGGTTGVSAQVLPKFKIAFPEAMALVESAARAGEQGGTVHTWLGRTSVPGNFGDVSADDDPTWSQARRTRARSYGRFTRNFICQGTAAEWALLWMAGVRQRLRTIAMAAGETPLGRDPITFGPHLVFFLHDEILVHTPIEFAERVQEAVRDAANEAGSRLFGQSAVEFPISTRISPTYSNPKEKDPTPEEKDPTPEESS